MKEWRVERGSGLFHRSHRRHRPRTLFKQGGGTGLWWPILYYPLYRQSTSESSLLTSFVSRGDEPVPSHDSLLFVSSAPRLEPWHGVQNLSDTPAFFSIGGTVAGIRGDGSISFFSGSGVTKSTYPAPWVPYEGCWELWRELFSFVVYTGRLREFNDYICGRRYAREHARG